MRARAITLTVVLAAAVPAAYADNALRPERIPTKARQLAEKGRSHHQAGDYDGAVSAFKEAYVLAPSASLLFNIAQAYRLGGRCDESAWMYRRFLDTNPVGDHRSLAEGHLSVVEKCGTGGLRVNVRPPKLEAVIPEPKLDTNDTKLTLRARPVIDHSRGGRYKRIGIGVGAGGLVALAGAAVFAMDARDAENSVAETYRRGGKWSDVEDTHVRGQRSSTIATVLGIGGGLGLASGVVMYALGRHYERAQYVAVTPTTGGAQVSLSWGF